MDKNRKVACPYCGKNAKLIDAKEIYKAKGRGMLWYCGCVPGGAIVGCHDNTSVPLGRLADTGLRSLKVSAHKFFDPVWQSGVISRDGAYRLLAAKMGIKYKKCHFGLFDKQQCRDAITATMKLRKELRIT